MKKIACIIGLLLLVSCASSEKLEGVKTSKYIMRSEISTAKQTPIHNSVGGFSEKIFSGEWISFVNDLENFIIEYPADYPKESPIFMSDISFEISSSCSPSILGVSKPIETPSTSDKTLWGKVDVWKNRGEGDFGYEERKQVVCRNNNVSYGFCSQKDGKTVVICITQVTDNETLAKQIFDSFRWTK